MIKKDPIETYLDNNLTNHVGYSSKKIEDKLKM